MLKKTKVFSLFVTARYSSVVKWSVLMYRSGKTAIISSSSPSVMTGSLPNRSLKWVYHLFSVSDLLFPFNTPFLADFLPLISLMSFQLSACWCDQFTFSPFWIISSRWCAIRFQQAINRYMEIIFCGKICPKISFRQKFPNMVTRTKAPQKLKIFICFIFTRSNSPIYFHQAINNSLKINIRQYIYIHI